MKWNEQDVNKEIPVPLYYQLKQIFLTRIQTGYYQVGDMLPTEQELCLQYQLSRPTVRQALNELAVEGHLQRVKGKGTFVCRPKIEDRFFKNIVPFHQEIRQKGMQPSTQVLACQVATDEAIASKLGLSPKSKLIYLERLRFADQAPVVYLQTHLPYQPFKALLKVDLAKESLYETLEHHMQTRIQKVSRIFEAVLPRPHVATLLQMDASQPICQITTLAFAANETPVEYSKACYRGDLYQFSVDIYRD